MLLNARMMYCCRTAVHSQWNLPLIILSSNRLISDVTGCRLAGWGRDSLFPTRPFFELQRPETEAHYTPLCGASAKNL